MGERAIKVCLTNRGRDQETPWAYDLGPAPGPSGSRRVRLANVPFMHAKPTWGDVIVVSPDDGGLPTWDRGGASWEQLGDRILEDGGRWAMIVDYGDDGEEDDADASYHELVRACAAHDIVCEGAWPPRDNEPGRVFLAVRVEHTDAVVMDALRAQLGFELFQIHPEPASSAPLTREAERLIAKRARANRPGARGRAAASKAKAAKPSKAKAAKPSKAKPAKPSKAKPAKPSKAKPAKPSKAKAAKPSKAKPAKKRGRGKSTK